MKPLVESRSLLKHFFLTVVYFQTMSLSCMSKYARNPDVQRSIIMITCKTQLQFFSRQMPLLCNYKASCEIKRNVPTNNYKNYISDKRKVENVDYSLMRFDFNH
jgi:hypothetical protein